MNNLLTRERANQGLEGDDEWVALREKDKAEKISKEEWEDLKDMAISTFLSCLAGNISSKLLP